MDYQPGGSAGVNIYNDPLSDRDKCARDIFLFQHLGVNAVRVYSINTQLDHRKCMSLLAEAGIYLILDVNSPLYDEHLNRYEPWTTYTKEYMSHIFTVLTEFSGYNNTLAFFAGNEVVNDKKSSQFSPTYIKAVIRDMKWFLRNNSLRRIPIGYSAADDLKYRISLAEYLACYADSPDTEIDFYGVNSYQWCGEQTFHTSGYDKLVKDYSNFNKPIFFSEYGCNKIQPRIFQEVGSIYSKQMSRVFSGGLLYEFVQEPNNYGLVDYDKNGNAIVLPDFYAFKERLSMILDTELEDGSNNVGYKTCKDHYPNLVTTMGLPPPPAKGIMRSRTGFHKGELVWLNLMDQRSHYKIYRSDGSLWTSQPMIIPTQNGDNIWESESFEPTIPALILIIVPWIIGLMI